MKLVRSPWTQCFESLVEDAVEDLVISSPFVSRAACDRLIRCVDRKGRKDTLQLTLVTNLCLDNLVSGVTNAAAILEVSQQLPRTTIRFIPTLHAKIYVADRSRAVISSANLTDGGLYRNLEYGVEVDDPVAVCQVRKDVEDYAALGPIVPMATLASLAESAGRLAVEKTVVEGAAAKEILGALRKLLDSANETVLKARTAGRSLTAILQDTIVYLLARGPLTTPEIHARVQQIHPDLCDDTISRVIDGRAYGKRWKHSVRTAQYHLGQSKEIELREGTWFLVKPDAMDLPTVRHS